MFKKINIYRLPSSSSDTVLACDLTYSNADVPWPPLLTNKPLRTMHELKASIQNEIASIPIGMLEWATQNAKLQLQECVI